MPCVPAQVYDIDDDGVVDEEDFRRMYIGGLGVKDDVHIEEVPCTVSASLSSFWSMRVWVNEVVC